MDKKSFTGLLLIGAVLIIWTQFMRPEPSAEKEQNRTEQVDEFTSAISKNDGDQIAENERINAIENNQLLTQEDSIRLKIKQENLSKEHGVFYGAVANGEELEPIVIENDKVTAYINPVGGRIEKVVLKEYNTWTGTPLVLMDERSEMSFLLPFGNSGYLDTEKYKFDAQGGGFSVTEGNNKSLKLRLNSDDPDKYIEYTYAMEGGDYEVDFSIEVHNLEDEIDLRRNDLIYKWNLIGLTNEKSKTFEKQKSSIFYKYVDEERDYLSESSDEEIQVEADLEWVAMKQYFFSAVAIPEVPFESNQSTMAIKILEDTALTKEYKTELTFALSDSRDPLGNIKYYFGPNQYQILSDYDNGMGRIVDTGWGIFGWMNKWLVIPVFNFLSKFIDSYGIIILLLTVFIKMLLYPLTYKNYLSSAKMKVLKPDIAELTEKFKDDAVKKQQATMGLYRQSGVNPMAGCVPMLIQMPVLYAMFNFFPSSIELRQQSFLWANDLSSFDSIFEWAGNIPVISAYYGNHISLFTLLMAASTILYTRMNSSQMPDAQPGMPNMKVMMYIFPFMMLFFFNSYPSGLSYYYLLANVISMLQMFVIKKYFIDEKKIRAKIETNKKKPVKKSKFQQRLEDAAKQQKAAKSRKR
ncbi:MAG: YidC/Oxa1 family membrane protein insertase [Patiriisocius sp.]|jgi:YidC/Oxa1 family membrane protein insertase